MTRQKHALPDLVSDIAIVAVALIALIIASIAGGLGAPTLWTLVTILGAGFLLARGASRGRWGGLSSLGPQRQVARDTGSGSDAMTVSEEQLRVDKRPRVRERVRLRKYVVTEEVTVTVPVRREHLRVERELVSEDEADPGVAELGAPAPDYSITLLEEQLVVDKRVVPRERVTVHKEVVTEQQQIAETVRRERVDVERDEARGRGASPTRGKETT